MQLEQHPSVEEHSDPDVNWHVAPSQQSSFPVQSVAPQSHCSPASRIPLPHLVVTPVLRQAWESSKMTFLNLVLVHSDQSLSPPLITAPMMLPLAAQGAATGSESKLSWLKSNWWPIS